MRYLILLSFCGKKHIWENSRKREGFSSSSNSLSSYTPSFSLLPNNPKLFRRDVDPLTGGVIALHRRDILWIFSLSHFNDWFLIQNGAFDMKLGTHLYLWISMALFVASSLNFLAAFGTCVSKFLDSSFKTN